MAKTYTVISPVVVAKGTDGRVAYYYQGSVLEDNVPAEERQRLVDLGMVSATETLAPIGWGPDDSLNGTTPPDGQPGTAASKADWVNYATSRGMAREEAEAATKQSLIELYG